MTLHCETSFTSEGLNAAPRTRAQARSRGLRSISKVQPEDESGLVKCLDVF